MDAAHAAALFYVKNFQIQALGATVHFGSEAGCEVTHGAALNHRLLERSGVNRFKIERSTIKTSKFYSLLIFGSKIYVILILFFLRFNGGRGSMLFQWIRFNVNIWALSQNVKPLWSFSD